MSGVSYTSKALVVFQEHSHGISEAFEGPQGLNLSVLPVEFSTLTLRVVLSWNIARTRNTNYAVHVRLSYCSQQSNSYYSVCNYHRRTTANLCFTQSPNSKASNSGWSSRATRATHEAALYALQTSISANAWLELAARETCWVRHRVWCMCIAWALAGKQMP